MRASTKLAALAAMTACLCLPSSLAWSQTWTITVNKLSANCNDSWIPPGSYQLSCANCMVVPDGEKYYLTALCRSGTDKPKNNPTKIEVVSCNSIYNNKASLACGK